MADFSAADAAAAVLGAVERDCSIASATVIASVGDPRPGARLAVLEDGTVMGDLGGITQSVLHEARGLLGTGGSRTATIGGATVFIDAVLPPNHLVIVGAGHIAVPLADIGVLLGHRVTVLDDREEFATEARFPHAASVKRMDFTDPFADVRIGARSYVVLVTRAHKYDYDCLLRLLELPVSPKYIGMIGSRRRVRAAFQALLDHGVARDRLAGVHAPVGIEIGAETPAEIAVSIASEIIAIHRGAVPTESLTARERVLDRLLKEA
jgi:xanthine dehydrogenase accessory factor